MTKFASRLLATTAMLLAGASIAAPAQAQRVDRIIAFGDSYADDGNFFELTGIPRPAAYPNGRFSNGTNFVDTMSLLLGRPVDNFAIGGAYTGSGNINGIPGLGFQLEYQFERRRGEPVLIYGDVVARVGVISSACGLHHFIELAGAVLLRAVEHHVLEEVRYARRAGPLVARAYSIKDVQRDAWDRMIFLHHYLHPVL